ncbi:WUSCHEL-related homeobox 5-like [Vigna angularis]|uniref:WUSCHEL-related homeobox 5-like n=1 Tax=Phaseolus angularis TaxID=3914 RepID=UPI0022B33842|nr:WUSCHEL-related homeobox 5-like [Vigna angularis]
MDQNLTNLQVQDKIGYKRWSPTREQVALLEALFAFGIRNPNREQVHEIATRLKVYGEIGEYSVYCWFQNYGYREKQRCLKRSTATTSYSPIPLLPHFMDDLSRTPSSMPDRVTLDLFSIPPVLVKVEVPTPFRFQVKAPSVELSLRLPSTDE